MAGEINSNDLMTFDGPVDATYATALDAVAPNVVNMIDQQQTPGESWSDTLQRILPLIAATVQQKEILNIQLERAKAGLPPLDQSAFGVGVQVGLSPELKTALLLGGGVLAFIFLSKRKG